jgi:hypothetical protein
MTTRTRLLLALTLLLPTLAAAQVPLRNTLAFSARIADAGQPIVGSHAFVFTFFDAETAGTPVWTEAQTLTVNDGVVAAALGADGANLFPANLFDGSDRWLEVSMDANVFAGRMAVRAAPYAMRAPLSCQVATGTTYTIAAGGGLCPLRSPCYCIIGVYCPCDECFSGTCPAGYTVTGGGYWAGNSTTNFHVISSIPYGTDRWKLRVINNDTASLLITPYAQCCKAQ